MIKEVWKEIPKCPGYYVSTLGNVKSVKKHNGSGERFISQNENEFGYLRFSMWVNNKRITITTHKAVAMAFLGHVPNGHSITVDHIDGNKKNNSLSNLQLVSHRKNVAKSSKNKYGYTGVDFHKQTGKFKSKAMVNGKITYIGLYDTAKEAGMAYDDFVKSNKKI